MRRDRSEGRPGGFPTWRDYSDDRPDARRQRIMDRKEIFERLNALAAKSGDAWLVSVAGAPEVRVEVLPTSTFPSKLRDAGYALRDEGTRERIVPNATTEVIVDGKKEARTLRHAGLIEVRIYSFEL